MSWSFQAVGSVAAVARALETQNAGLTGQSKAEWDEARPALAALVGANVGAVRVNASGHASIGAHGTKVSGACSVTVEPLYGFVA